VGRSCRARQQPHEDSSAVDAPIGEQAKSRLTIPINFLFVAEETAQLIAKPHGPTGATRNRIENRVNIPGECRDPLSVCPGFIG
jgi:hypothetical protein